MAKISPVSIKYMIYAKFEAEGTLEKPDVIGAIFGQTEGLLGSDLEMRDLQKEGKIGRIEVETKTENGKTFGSIQIPSSLDKTETTLIAAAMETIERIGPSPAKIEVDRIDDVRENKREYILERAKKLLEVIEEKMPKTREITRNLKAEAKAGKLKEYGEEKLPCGSIEGREIIVVEGRADVINLLRNGVENVIGMDGIKLPKTIKELSYDKGVTLFVDGDRGGKLIAKNVIDNARIDYIAFAPDGKEVEELSNKEILFALRKRIPAQDFLTKRGGKKDMPSENSEDNNINLEANRDKLQMLLKEIENTGSAILLDKKLEVIDEIPVRKLFSVLKDKKAHVIIVDTATPSVVKTAEKNNIRNIIARNFTNYESKRVNLISL